MKRRPGAGRGLFVALALTAVSAGTPAGVPAQGGSGTEPPRTGCFTGRPLPACTSFWIFEMQGVVPVASRERVAVGADGSRHATETFTRELEWNVGHAVNLSPRVAAGAVLTAGTGSPDGLAGIKGRIRYRVRPAWSLELEGGWLRSKAAGTAPQGVDGLTADLRLNVSDRVAAFVRWDRLWLDDEETFPGGPDDALTAGLGLGSWPAVVGTGVAGLVFAVALGLFIPDAS